ncbi:MAG: hypothetical protein WC614_07660 [bacterium]
MEIEFSQNKAIWELIIRHHNGAQEIEPFFVDEIISLRGFAETGEEGYTGLYNWLRIHHSKFFQKYVIDNAQNGVVIKIVKALKKYFGIL